MARVAAKAVHLHCGWSQASAAQARARIVIHSQLTLSLHDADCESRKPLETTISSHSESKC